MTDKEQEDLKNEIKHIFDSGANEVRVFEMVKNFINQFRSFSSCSNERADNLEEELNRLKEFVGFEMLR